MIEVSDTWKSNQYKNFTPKGKSQIKMTVPINGNDYNPTLNYFTFSETGFTKGSEITSEIFDYSNFLNPSTENDITNNLANNSYVLDSEINLDKPEGVKNPSAIVLGTSDITGALIDDGTSNVMVSFENAVWINKVKIVFSDYEANEYPNKFKYFTNGTLGYEDYTFENTNFSNRKTVELNFDGIYLQNFGINLLKWCSPLKRAKIDKIIFYTYLILDDTSIKNTKLDLEVSSINAYAPKNQLSFDLITYGSDFEKKDFSSIFNNFLYKSEVVFSFGYSEDGEYNYKKISTTYVSEWSYDKSNLSFSIVTQNKLYFMNELFLGKTPDIYSFVVPSSEENENVEITKEISHEYNYCTLFKSIVGLEEGAVYLDSYQDLYDKCKDDIETDLPITDKSGSVLLLEIAQATNLVLSCDVEGNICINACSTETNDDYISKTTFVYSEEPCLEEDGEISQVKVNYYGFNTNYDDVVVDEIVDRETNVETQEAYYYSFDEGKKIKYTISGLPYQGSVSQTAYSLTFFINAFGAYEIIVESADLISKGSVTSSGKLSNGSLQEVENELIYSEEIATSVSKYLKKLFQKNDNYTITLRIDPRLQSLDIIPIVFEEETKYIRAEKINIDFEDYSNSTIEGVII